MADPDTAVPPIAIADLSKSFLAKVDTYRVTETSPREKYIFEQLEVPRRAPLSRFFRPSTFSVGEVFDVYTEDRENFWNALWDRHENIQLAATEVSSLFLASLPCNAISEAKIKCLRREAWRDQGQHGNKLAELAYTLGFRLDGARFVIDEIVNYNCDDCNDWAEDEEFWETEGYYAWQMEYELWCKTVGRRFPSCHSATNVPKLLNWLA